MKKKNVKVHENGIIPSYLRLRKYLALLYLIHFYLNLYWRIGKELFDFATRGQARVVVLLLVIWKPTISLFLSSLLVLLWYLILFDTFYKKT